MKKIVTMFLYTCLIGMSFDYVYPEESQCQTNIFKIDEVTDYTTFLNIVLDQDIIFLEQYRDVLKSTSKIIDTLHENKTLNSELQTESIKMTKKAQRKLEEYSDAMVQFQNSSNPKIQKLVKEVLLMNEYAKLLLLEIYDFIRSPYEFISEGRFKKIREYNAIFEEQHDYTYGLINDMKESALSEINGIKKQIDL